MCDIYRNTIGRALSGVVAKAKTETRLICGLLDAILYLEENPLDTLLCILPQTRPGDAASHMHTVLLQAFCYENCIPVVQVDDGQKLAELCGIETSRKDLSPDCECALITRDVSMPLNLDEDIPMTANEQILTDFYECTIEEFPRPIIQLPR